jgi:hypothetical protein
MALLLVLRDIEADVLLLCSGSQARDNGGTDRDRTVQPHPAHFRIGSKTIVRERTSVVNAA